MKTISRYGVIGNPVTHSLSPDIHRQFAKQFGHTIDYQKYHLEVHQLKTFVSQFFEEGGKGLNVTLPFKQSVISLTDRLTDDAKLANSVNTLFVDGDGLLVGDTTDGRGLLLDLNKCGFDISNKRLLVIGAGGASQSILLSLLKAGAKISLHNRTIEKVIELQNRFSSIGTITTFDSGQHFDGVINATSQFNQPLMAPVKLSISSDTFCYDLNYAARADEFKNFSGGCGCQKFSDGLGMLIGQAAYSYKIWCGLLPDFSDIQV